MPQIELQTIVLYDVTHDRTRSKVSNKCLDFGLVRFQYSAFQGPLTRNRREELALALHELIEYHGGKISVVPICQSDCMARIELYVETPVSEEPVLSIYSEADDD